MIVVDTSAWIEYFRATGSRVHRTLHRQLEEEVELAVTEVVLMEILAGARSPRHVRQLRLRLLQLPVLPLRGVRDYESAAALYRRCHRRGETIRELADCLVAVPAITAGAPILHADRDFEKLARNTSVKTFQIDD